MKKILMTASSLLAVLALLVAGCTPDDPTAPKLSAPTAQQTLVKYVALGNSLTAGFMDSGLSINGQLTSFPRLLARQFGLDVSTTSEAFTQPYIAPPGIGSTSLSNPGYAAGVLHWTGTGIAVIDSTPLTSVPNLLLASTVPTPYHNLGVPGAWLADITGATSSANSTPPGNSYFDFILRNQPATTPFLANRSQFEQAVAKGPTLVTLWIGNNDVLGGATSGDPNQPGGAPMTPVATFAAGFQALLGNLIGALTVRTGFAPVVAVANIPSITSAPLFVPVAQFEQAIGGGWPWGYAEGADVQFVLFPTLSWVQNPGNQGSPIPSTRTLTADEVTLVEDHITGYNAAILTQVNRFPSATLVDVNTLLASRPATERTHFLFLVSGGMSVEAAAAATRFSLDGIHPNAKGYGLVANEFIKEINALLGTAVPDVDLATLVWDPTYSTYGKAGEAAPHAGLQSPAAAAAIQGMFAR